MYGFALTLLHSFHTQDFILYKKQEGHDGPGSLTWVCEPRIFKLTDFGIKWAKVIIFTNYEGSLSSLWFAQNGYLF